jgi:plasmid stabilization system protein ParE
MKYEVRITPEAEADLKAIGDFIVSRDAPLAALRFVRSLRKQIATLRKFPERHGIAPEADLAGVELRQKMHGVYRVLYTVQGSTVIILAVRHGARRPLRPDELPRRAGLGDEPVR